MTISSGTQNRFNFEAEPWNVSGLLQASITSTCASFYILGGVNALDNGGYYVNQWTNLPTHDIFYFTIRFLLIGSWSSTDIISLIFDSKTITVGNIDIMSSEFGSFSCGGATRNVLYLYTISGRVFHTDSSLTLKVASDMTTSPSIANFGMRAINILFANNTNSYTEDYCFKLYNSAIYEALPNKCACGLGQYEDPSNPGSCLSCDASCTDCFGPSPGQCYKCATQYSFVESQCIQCDSSCVTCSGPGSSQCTTCASGLWLYWDGTCRSSCTSPTTSQLVYDALKICNLPCPEGQYMLYNGTCVGSCDSPLLVVDNSTGVFCDKPCPDGEFVYANGSCLGSCDLPFVVGVTLEVDTCYWKCESDQYMRWDYTCWDSCDAPLEVMTNSTGNFCSKPCEDGEFWYANGSCIAGTCDYPFKQGLALGVVDTCLFKCDAGEFLYENDGSCVKPCKFPFLVRDGEGAEGKYCYSPCNSTEFVLADRSCSVNCSSPDYYTEKIDASVKVCLKEGEDDDNDVIRTIAKVTKTEGQISFGLIMALTFGKTGSSSSLCLISLAKMLEYIKYMKVDYSEKLNLMFHLHGSSALDLRFEVPLSEKIEEKFPDHELPENFEDYELRSSFFLNYWETLGTLLIVLAVTLMVSLLAIVLKKRKSFYKPAFVWLETVFKWNFLLMVFCSSFEGVVFFTSLEARTLDLSSVGAFVSFTVCIVANVFAVLVLGRMVFVLKDIRKLKYLQVHDLSMKVKSRINPHQKWKNYQVLFLNCKETKPMQQAFFIIFLARVYFFHLTIGYIFPDPLIQSVIITCLSVFMLTYLITQRPLVEKWDFIKMVMNELIVLTVNLCVLVLAALTHNGKQNSEQTELFSMIIIIANVVFNSIALISLGIELIIALVKIYKKIKAQKVKGVTSLIEIFMIIFAGEAMAMEEVHHLSPPEVKAKKIPVKKKLERVELEIPQDNDEKNLVNHATHSDLLKYQSAKSIGSLIDDERLSFPVARSHFRHYSRKISSHKFEGSLKELEEKRMAKQRTLVRSEYSSGGFLSPQSNMGDAQAPESSLRVETESDLKVSLSKTDTSDNLKLIFENIRRRQKNSKFLRDN